MRANEKLALAVFDMAGRLMDESFTYSIPNPGCRWESIEKAKERASGGESALLDFAMEAWGARTGLTSCLSRIDPGLREQVLCALTDAYGAS